MARIIKQMLMILSTITKIKTSIFLKSKNNNDVEVDWEADYNINDKDTNNDAQDKNGNKFDATKISLKAQTSHDARMVCQTRHRARK